MAFSFGSTTTPAAAPGGLFGAPAPAASGGLFGSSSAPAPSGGLFGSTPAPAGGLFGGAPTPAPSGGLFGSSSTPAPSAGGLFGSNPAPAPSGGLFGSSAAPAPSAGSLFGGAPSAFGAASQPLQQQQQYLAPLSGNTPYSQLQPNLKNAIDDIYRQMMSHRRTLATVQTMAPSLLERDQSTIDDYKSPSSPSQPSGADVAAGSPSKKTKYSNLAQQSVELQHEIEQVAKLMKENLNNSSQLKLNAGELLATAKLHGLWPIETIATRRQVILTTLRQRVEGASSSSTTNNTTDKSINLTSMPELDVLALQHILDMRAASVDRKEQIPSPYYWEMLHQLEKKGQAVLHTMNDVSSRLVREQNGSNSVDCHPSMILYQNDTSFPARCAKLAKLHNHQFLQIAHGASRLHEEIELLKVRHRHFVQQRGGVYEDPFLKADVEEMRKERELHQKIMEERLAANADAPVAPAAATPAAGGLFGSTPAPAAGGLFGSTPAPASGGLFGSKAPAPLTGGLFGSSPAPAAGGLFGSTPAPAPTGGLFGTPAAAPAPSTGGLFGSTPAPAPAGGLFGTPAAAPAPSTGGLFGSTTPAPAAGAPAGGSLFGAPAPAAGGLFAAPTTPASTLAPRKKPSRSGGRRR